MAVKSCKPEPVNPYSAARNERYETEYVRRYVVITDDAEDEATLLVGLPGLSMFSAHPSDAFARLKNIAITGPRRTVAGDGTTTLELLWGAVVTYGYMNPFEAAEGGDPADCPIEVSIEGVLEEQAADVDNDGNPVTNSAGDYYDPAVTKDFQRIKINITRFERQVDVFDLLWNYALHKNGTPWQGFPAGSVKMAVPQLIPYFSQYLNVIRWQVKYVFEVNQDTWKRRVPDRGFRSFDRSTSKLKVILDEYGYQPEEPFFLDGNGQPLPMPVDPDSLVINEHDVYRDAEFNDLGFPEDIMQTAVFA